MPGCLTQPCFHYSNVYLFLFKIFHTTVGLFCPTNIHTRKNLTSKSFAHHFNVVKQLLFTRIEFNHFFTRLTRHIQHRATRIQVCRFTDNPFPAVLFHPLSLSSVYSCIHSHPLILLLPLANNRSLTILSFFLKNSFSLSLFNLKGTQLSRPPFNLPIIPALEHSHVLPNCSLDPARDAGNHTRPHSSQLVHSSHE